MRTPLPIPGFPLRRRAVVTGVAAALAAPAVRSRAAAPWFRLSLAIPDSQEARVAWGTLMARQISKLGIDVVPAYLPPAEIAARRGEGAKGFADGGWDMTLSRSYYPTRTISPALLFGDGGRAVPGDAALGQAMGAIDGARDAGAGKAGLLAFQKRWLEIEPSIVLFYPEDLIAASPGLKGVAGSTARPAFPPRPEDWTMGEGVGSAAFACWPPPGALLPIYWREVGDSDAGRQVYDTLMDYGDGSSAGLQPALASSVEESADGLRWVINLRPGVRWHSGEAFSAEDVVFTFDTILDPAAGSEGRGLLLALFGGAGAYRVTGPLQVTVELRRASAGMRGFVLGAVPIMPAHAYRPIGAANLRAHPANTWRESWVVPTSQGNYACKGGVGTGAWVCAGFDPGKRTMGFVRNGRGWRRGAGPLAAYRQVGIQGVEAVLAAVKAREIDAHDAIYDIGAAQMGGGALMGVDGDAPGWLRLLRFDSWKWQQMECNPAHAVLGTGVGTPLGRQTPGRAAEAAALVRKAISYAVPRDEIIRQVGGHGQPGTVPIPFTAPEYDHDGNQPIPFDMDLARQTLARAGYG